MKRHDTRALLALGATCHHFRTFITREYLTKRAKRERIRLLNTEIPLSSPAHDGLIWNRISQFGNLMVSVPEYAYSALACFFFLKEKPLPQFPRGMLGGKRAPGGLKVEDRRCWSCARSTLTKKQLEELASSDSSTHSGLGGWIRYTPSAHNKPTVQWQFRRDLYRDWQVVRMRA